MPARDGVGTAGGQQHGGGAMNIEALCEKLAGYLKPADIDGIRNSYRYSEQAHDGQTRDSGKPYITHPLTVADILADWHFDPKAISAALLHDTIEDTPITLQQIRDTFGAEIATLVDGLSKVARIHNIEHTARTAENFRKLLLAAVSDWRVVFIKLADRLHNMRTLSAVAEGTRRRRIARETLEIFAPIAGRLGLNHVEEEMQILSFRHLYPYRFRVLSNAIKKAREGGRTTINTIEKDIRKKMAAEKIPCHIEHRRKNLFSIHRKMVREHLSFANVEDIIGFRLLVENRRDCYIALGIMHELYYPMRERFKDYIAMPKSNGYQSLHTRLIAKTGAKLDVQIRTHQMHQIAERGLAAHWLYKQYGDNTDTASQKIQQQTLHHLSGLVSLHAENEKSPGAFMENVKVELFPKEMYILTPGGDVITLPRGASALDLAYAIHTEVGDRAQGAVVNGKSLPVAVTLNNGDQVQIITHPQVKPKMYWLGYAKTARARSRIRHILNAQSKEALIHTGKTLLENAVKSIDAKRSLANISDAGWQNFFKTVAYKDHDSLYRHLAFGELVPAIVARAILQRPFKSQSADGENKALLIKGAGKSAITLAKCCYPLPAEPIVGLLRKEHGLVIHLARCQNLAGKKQKRQNEKWIEVQWSHDADQSLHNAQLNLQCRNQPSLLALVSGVVGGHGINIVDFTFSGGYIERDNIEFQLTVQVHSQKELTQLINDLSKNPEVLQCRQK